MALITGLFQVVDQQCTTPQIAELLKSYKDRNEKTKKEIRYSGTKAELVQNLQRVVSLNLIPKAEVYHLIQHSEENGHQHVYFFLPSERIRKRCDRATEIGTMLFGEDWGPQYFPRFDRSEEETQWADFRVSVNGKVNDWLAKLYGHELILKLKNRRRENVSTTHYREILDWEAEDYNTVLLARWNAPGLFEVRIDSIDTRHHAGIHHCRKGPRQIESWHWR